jgi:hypothetical protein
MVAWSICILTALVGLRFLLADLALPWGGITRERADLRKVILLLQEIEETLGAGLVPGQERWAAMQALPVPWGALTFESLQELRAAGGALLPTLRRLRGFATEQDAALGEARSRSAQALAQAFVCAMLVPVFGSALYWLLPGLDTRPVAWFLACAFAVALAGAGSLWMLSIAERARWAGLPLTARPWVLAAHCAGERFLALVRSGNPADLAWTRACALLTGSSAGLAVAWGASVWKPTQDEWASGTSRSRRACPAQRVLEEAGSGLRKAVQVSLMEGRPCTERVEAALGRLRQELRSLVERELGLLGTRALKPLFVCVAPGLFLLLGFGFWVSWRQVASGVLGSF